MKEIHAVYFNSLYFKNVYLYLTQNKVSTSQAEIKRTKILAGRYLSLDSLLFSHNATPQKSSAFLAISRNCVDRLVSLYHSSIFRGYQGVTKIYFTMIDKFFIPDLIHYLRTYIKCCHICQLHRNEKPQPRLLHHRIYHDYKSMTRLSMDLKVIPRTL